MFVVREIDQQFGKEGRKTSKLVEKAWSRKPTKSQGNSRSQGKQQKKPVVRWDVALIVSCNQLWVDRMLGFLSERSFKPETDFFFNAAYINEYLT